MGPFNSVFTRKPRVAGRTRPAETTSLDGCRAVVVTFLTLFFETGTPPHPRAANQMRCWFLFNSGGRTGTDLERSEWEEQWLQPLQ